MACSVPSTRSAPSMRVAIVSSLTPTAWRFTCAGFASGPRKLNVVGTPSSLRAGPRKRIAGW